MEFNEEYKKFIEEKRNLLQTQFVTLPNLCTVEMQFDNETENNINLYKMRLYLKSLIFNIGSNKETQFVNSSDEIRFLKEYKEFVAIKRKLFPSFIFDDFDAKKLEKCVEYKSSGHSLLETEEYYINEIKNQKIF